MWGRYFFVDIIKIYFDKIDFDNIGVLFFTVEVLDFKKKEVLCL